MQSSSQMSSSIFFLWSLVWVPSSLENHPNTNVSSLSLPCFRMLSMENHPESVKTHTQALPSIWPMNHFGASQKASRRAKISPWSLFGLGKSHLFDPMVWCFEALVPKPYHIVKDSQMMCWWHMLDKQFLWCLETGNVRNVRKPSQKCLQINWTCFKAKATHVQKIIQHSLCVSPNWRESRLVISCH